MTYRISDIMTLDDILYDLGNDVAIVSVNENNVEHAYFGYDEIESIEPDIWDAEVVRHLVVKRDFGFMVYIEL